MTPEQCACTECQLRRVVERQAKIIAEQREELAKLRAFRARFVFPQEEGNGPDPDPLY